MKTCGECKHFESCRTDNYKEYPACGAFAGLTNFERITASPEALAKFMDNRELEKTCGLNVEGVCWHNGTMSCNDCFLEWLNKEVEDESVDR